MKEDLLKIIEHFGVVNQLKKLNEECYEVVESIRNYEENKIDIFKEHIVEEIADLMVILEQFKWHYDLTSEEITKIFWNKVNRTLERIESGYYE